MMGNKSFFIDFTNFEGGKVTFGDGNVACVKGKGTICALGIPKLEDVLFIEGLKANLNSRNQICDKDFNVQFLKNIGKVFELNGKSVMTGSRTLDNFYVMFQENSHDSSSSLICDSSKLESIELWHLRLGHVNFNDLMKVANNELIKGICKLENPSNLICGTFLK